MSEVFFVKRGFLEVEQMIAGRAFCSTWNVRRVSDQVEGMFWRSRGSLFERL